ITEGRIQQALLHDPNLELPVPLGTVCVTKGDLLPCRWIFHLATHRSWEEMSRDAHLEEGDQEFWEIVQELVIDAIRAGLNNLIITCEEFEAKSIAIPLIGSGSLGFPTSLMADVILGTLHQILEEVPTNHLQKIQVVTLDEQVFQALKGRIEDIDWDFAKEKNFASEEDWEEFLAETGSESPVSNDPALGSEPEKGILEKDLEELREQLQTFRQREKRLLRQIEELIRENKELKSQAPGAIWGQSQPIDLWARIDLPSPLAYAQNLRMAETDPNRCHINMLNAIGIVSKYFSALICAEYLHAGCFSEDLNSELRHRFRQGPMTDGSWVWVGKRIARAFYDADLYGQLVREVPRAWITERGEWSGLSEALQQLVSYRNRIHDPVNADSGHASAWLELVLPVWVQMCKYSEPMTSYELLFIDQISDFSDDLGEEVSYSIKRLRGGFFVPPSETLKLRQHLKSGRLYLQSANSPDLLSLHPFLTYEYSRVTNNRETFCLDQIQHSTLHYKAFRYAHRSSLNDGKQFPL
ncbi:MAG: macro domain-containing protein, partial [bacterium]